MFILIDNQPGNNQGECEPQKQYTILSSYISTLRTSKMDILQKLLSAEAVIFDFDGTLAHTNDLWEYIDDEIFKQRETPIDEDNHMALIGGNKLLDICANFVAHYGFSDTAEEIYKEKVRIYQENLQKAHFIPGAAEFLQLLANNNKKYAIASANPVVVNKLIFEKHDKMSLVPETFASCDDCKGKPDPEIFIKAATQMGCKIENCVVFEDSVVGLTAARASGAFVVGVGNGSKGKELADFWVEDYTIFVQ